MRATAVLASALVRPATVLTAVCSSRRWLGTRDAEATLPTIDPEPTIVVECASCRPSCWLLGRARPSSVEGGRGAGRGLNPPSSGAGGSGGGGDTVKGGGTGECAEAVTATIQCSSPRAIDRRPQAGPVRVPRESNSEREMGQHLGRGVRHARHSPARPPCARDHPPRRAPAALHRQEPLIRGVSCTVYCVSCGEIFLTNWNTKKPSEHVSTRPESRGR